jgi:hypothetical protein
VVRPSKFLRQPDGRKLLLKLSVGVSFFVDNGTLKNRELRTLVEMVEVVVLVENIFSLALDFKETISYLDRRLMNQVFLRELIQIVSINRQGYTVL